MGYFLAVTAFKTVDAAAVSEAIMAYCKRYGIDAATLAAQTHLDSSVDIQIYTPINAWTVVLWPSYFNIHDDLLARSVSAEQNWLASTISVYDSDYWEHTAYNNNQQLHNFCSVPNYWMDQDQTFGQRHNSVHADPTALSIALSIPTEKLQPYLVDITKFPDPTRRVSLEDEFALDNFWVFTDFWRVMGITYPAEIARGLFALLRLPRNFADRLPMEE